MIEISRAKLGFNIDSPSSQRITSQPPLSLYIHLPWCIKKCPYCDFNSHEMRSVVAQSNDLDAALQARYLSALEADLQSSLPLIWGRVVHSIFIGGGTPSLFTAQAIDQLLTSVRTHVRLSADAEITMEANPGSFEQARFEGFSKAGVNRLSIGVQSFNDAKLKALGRVHDAAQAFKAIAVAQRYYKTFNIDLMYGLPSQTMGQLRADLEQALACKPPHLSYYQLTMEPNTLFAAKPPPLPPEDDLADMQALIEAQTSAAGFGHYEISAYAQPNQQARHNLNYWQFGDYLGIGAGAHGKLTFHDGIRRYARYKHPTAYMNEAIKGNACETETLLDPKDLPFEFMLNVLRLSDGVPTTHFVERTGLPLAAVNRAMLKACAKGLLDPNPAVIKATPLGLTFLNDLQEIFLPEE